MIKEATLSKCAGSEVWPDIELLAVKPRGPQESRVAWATCTGCTVVRLELGHGR